MYRCLFLKPRIGEDGYLASLIRWRPQVRVLYPQQIKKMKNIVLLICLVFFVIGCGVSRKATSHSSQKDSLIYKEIVRVDTLRVPQDRVQVVVDNTILKLKEKEIQDLNYQFLQYKQSTGSRANIQFKIVRDSVYIEGTCDSLELLSLRN